MALSRKGKIILSTSLFAVFLVLCVVGYGAWRVYSFLSSAGTITEAEIPPEIGEPRVTRGADFLLKHEIFRKTALSNTDLIIKGTGEPDVQKRQQMIEAETDKRYFGYSDVRVCGDHIIAAGKFGAFRLTPTGELEQTIFFDPKIVEVKILYWKTTHPTQTLDNLRIVDVDGDGACEFVSHNSVEGFAFFNSSGKLNWRYGDRELASLTTREDEPYITSVDVGDVDDDGREDFLISKKEDGIRAFSATQQELWFQPDEYPTADLVFVDTDGDKKRDLVELQGMGSKIRDKRTGKLRSELKLESSTSGVFEFPTKGKRPIAASYAFSEGYLTVSDLKGNALFKVEAPMSEVKKTATSGQPLHDQSYGDNTESIYEPKAKLVSLIPGQPKFLVIVGSYVIVRRSNVYVYDHLGKLVYHELLGEEAEALAIMPNSDGSEGFLVGGQDTVWKYAAR